jgi:hypothetical protein
MPLLTALPLALVSLVFVVFPMSLLLVLVATMGLGVPLMVLPTVVVYLAAALLPAALVRVAGFRQHETLVPPLPSADRPDRGWFRPAPRLSLPTLPAAAAVAPPAQPAQARRRTCPSPLPSG